MTVLHFTVGLQSDPPVDVIFFSSSRPDYLSFDIVARPGARVYSRLSSYLSYHHCLHRPHLMPTLHASCNLGLKSAFNISPSCDKHCVSTRFGEKE